MSLTLNLISRPSVPPNILQVQLVLDIQTATRNLAQKQIKWFRDQPIFQWLDASLPPEQLLELTLEEINRNSHAGECLVNYYMLDPQNPLPMSESTLVFKC